MVSGPTATAGGVAMSHRVKKMIRSNKEVVGNHSSSDISSVLKESNMELNETAPKLLQKGHFHEVKSRRYEKKENLGETAYPEFTVPKFRDKLNRNGRRSASSYCASRVNYEFRVVRDNRVNQNVNEDAKVASKTNFGEIDLDASAKSSSTQMDKQKHSDTRSTEYEVSLHGANRTHDSATSPVLNTRNQILVGEKRAIVPRAGLRLVGQRSTKALPTTASASSDSVAGVYSKSTDPVHVPSFNLSRSVNIGVIKCEVGIGRPSLQNSQAQSAAYSSTSVAPFLIKEDATRSEVFRQTSTPPKKSDRSNQVAATQTLTGKCGHNKSFWGNHRSSIVQQPTAGRQKASLPNKEWKPKLSQELAVPGLGVIGQSDASLSSRKSSGTRIEASCLPGNSLQVCVTTDKHVIIPHHLQVSEADRSHVTFGSFGMELDLSNNSSVGSKFFGDEHEQENKGPIRNFHSSASVEDNPSGHEVAIIEDHIGRLGSESLGSDIFVESNQPNSSSSSPSNLNDYSEMGIVESSSAENGPLELQKEKNNDSLPNFSEYDSRISYDMLYCSPAQDDNFHHGLASSQEASGLHHTNGGPTSFANLVQQQPSVSQIYPQVQISHFPNFFPYRQVYHQVYVQPMGVPSFTSNPAYLHPSSCNNYLVVPGGGSHPSNNTLKYAPSQFKGAPVASPTCYGNFTNPASYSFGSSGDMCPSGLADVSRVKYMDGNLVVPNPQADTSNIWIQTPRELPDVQPNLYYNMSGHAPHAAYLPSAAVSSYNTPTAQAQSQSTHFTFPGFHHPPQPSTMPNCHSVVHSQMQAMGCNVVGSQVGAYQPFPPNWTTNF